MFSDFPRLFQFFLTRTNPACGAPSPLSTTTALSEHWVSLPRFSQLLCRHCPYHSTLTALELTPPDFPHSCVSTTLPTSLGQKRGHLEVPIPGPGQTDGRVDAGRPIHRRHGVAVGTQVQDSLHAALGLTFTDLHMGK